MIMPPFEPAGEPPAGETEKEREKERKARAQGGQEAREGRSSQCARRRAGPGAREKKEEEEEEEKIEEDDEEELERLKAAMNDDTGELEASEEELLEELQTDCAVRVQKQARALKARARSGT